MDLVWQAPGSTNVIRFESPFCIFIFALLMEYGIRNFSHI